MHERNHSTKKPAARLLTAGFLVTDKASALNYLLDLEPDDLEPPFEEEPDLEPPDLEPDFELFGIYLPFVVVHRLV
jgi:hypothetical protein